MYDDIASFLILLKKIVALIPARSGSKGVPDKNIRKLGGFTLIEWAIKACKKSLLIEDIYISTDSENYAKEAIRAGAKAPFLRPKNISDDFSKDYDMVIHALNWLKLNDEEPEIGVHIRPTSPLRDPIVIDEAIKCFLNKPKATSLRSVHEMSESAYKTFEISKKGNLMPLLSEQNNIDSSNNPRQMFPNTYIANGYVDILSSIYIRNFKSMHGDNVVPFLTAATTEVDEEDDFTYLNYLIDKNPNILKKVFE